MKKFLIVLLCITFYSCDTTALIYFTSVSNKPTVIENVQGVKVTSEVSAFMKKPSTTMKEAIDAALKNAGEDYDILLNGSVKINWGFFYNTYITEGTAVRSKDLKASLGVVGYNNWLKENNTMTADTTETK
jgi:hypothetical protein